MIPVFNLGAMGQANGGGPLPRPDGALYRHPNPDGMRKACRNCVLWVAEENACAIHPRDTVVTEDMWCGYHLFGEPMATWIEFPNLQPVTPDLSGLQVAGPGVNCGSCKFFRDQGNGRGLCYGVSKPADRQPPQPVEIMGICARFESM